MNLAAPCVRRTVAASGTPVPLASWRVGLPPDHGWAGAQPSSSRRLSIPVNPPAFPRGKPTPSARPIRSIHRRSDG